MIHTFAQRSGSKRERPGSSRRDRTARAVAAASICWLAAAGCSGRDAATAESPDDATESATNVRVLVVEPTSLDEFLVVSGTLHPIRAAVLSTEEPGVVARIHRDKGTRVRASSPILELDRRILEAQKESTESARRLRQFNEEKTRQLFDQNSVSGQEMLLAHTQLEQAEAEAKIARLRYERALIRAPFDGFITDRYVELGELVAPGTRIARIVDPFTLKLAGALSEREVGWVKEAAPVRVFVEGRTGPVAGTVHWAGLEADPQTGKFAIEIQVDNPDLELRPGVLGRAQVETRKHEGVLAVPRDAIVQKLEGPFVFVADGDRARRRPVVLGPDQDLMVVVDRGLAAGDRLIVRGQRELVDGARIQVREEATTPEGSIDGEELPAPVAGGDPR